MKSKKTSAEQVWKQMEDVLIRRLRLSVTPTHRVRSSGVFSR